MSQKNHRLLLLHDTIPRAVFVCWNSALQSSYLSRTPSPNSKAMQPMRLLRRQGPPLLCLSAALLACALLAGPAVADGVTPSEARRLRDEVPRPLRSATPSRSTSSLIATSHLIPPATSVVQLCSMRDTPSGVVGFSSIASNGTLLAKRAGFVIWCLV
jgi:hypothetical protein